MPMSILKLPKSSQKSTAKSNRSNVLTTLNPGQLMVKLVKDELTDLMGGDAVGIHKLGVQQ